MGIFFTILISLLIVFIVIYFTKPNRQRLFGALVAGIAFGVLNILADILAYNFGWWQYRDSINISYAPIYFYILPILIFGCSLSLIGWRIAKKYGKRGLILFIAFLTLFGSIRDNYYAQKTNIFIWGNGIIPIIMDALLWALFYTIAQVIMYLIAGDYKKDKPLTKLKYFFKSN